MEMYQRRMQFLRLTDLTEALASFGSGLWLPYHTTTMRLFGLFRYALQAFDVTKSQNIMVSIYLANCIALTLGLHLLSLLADQS